MITIRLQRRGRKNDPSFRVVVVDSKKKPKTGNYLEMVGSHDPRADRTALDGERITHWIKNGATVSDTVHNLLVSHKIIDAKKINVLPSFKVVSTPSAGDAEAVAEVPEVSSEAQEGAVAGPRQDDEASAVDVDLAAKATAE
ncbi:MAG: 30S ribosomal protein S16 [bacterium]|nr:30S ribosomal protein S16 [bacterium]